MAKTIFLGIGLLARHVAAAPVEAHYLELFESLDPIDPDSASVAALAQRGRELFPMLIGTKCQRFCQAQNAGRESVTPRMAIGDDKVKALEMLALNENMKTVVASDSMCTRRQAMARAAGLAAGLGMAAVNAPAFAAQTKSVKMGTDSGQLLFVPDEVTICKGDTVTWVNNKGGPHNVVFDEEAIPSGVSVESISMDDQLGEEGATFSKKFDVAGSYAYYCEPHRGAGMNGNLIVE